MRIVRGILALSTVAIATAAWAGKRGNGDVVTEVRQARGFTQVDLRLPLDAEVTEGRDFAVKVTVDENLQPAIVSEIRGDTLVVRCDGSVDLADDSRIEISLPELKGVAATGSGDVTVTGSRKRDLSLASSGSGDLTYHGPAASLRVGAAGSGDVEVELSGEANDVEVGVRGSGDVTLRGGRARELVAAVAGSGSVNADALTAHSGRLATAGSGDIEATLNGGNASFAVAGSGSITWHGTASVTNQASAGSGEITHE